MKQLFSYNKQELPTITRTEIIITIAWGLFFAFVFYSFLTILREVGRLYTITEHYDILILSDKELNFYNLFFAFLSLIFAQSICLARLFNKPRKAFEKNIFRYNILSDQITLNAFFLTIIFRLAPVFIFLVFAKGGFYTFSFYPKFNFLLVLILIVLFLQNWLTIRRIYKRKARKWMLYSALAISVFAFPLSRFNLIDYQRLNQFAFDRNMIQKHDIELPEVEFVERSLTFGMNVDVYLANQPESAKPVLVFNRKEISFDDFEQNFPVFKDSLIKNYWWRPDWHHILLYVDKSTPILYVNRVKDVLINNGIFRVGYVVVPRNREFDRRYYTNNYLFWRLPNRNLQVDEDLSEYELLLVRFVNNNLQVNDIIVFTNDFYAEIKRQIRKHENYLFQFVVDDAMPFADYIFVLSEIQRAINTIREEYAMENYPEKYTWFYYHTSVRFEIIEKIPLRLMEIDSLNEKKK
jgi:hypothetical protein